MAAFTRCYKRSESMFTDSRRTKSSQGLLPRTPAITWFRGYTYVCVLVLGFAETYEEAAEQMSDLESTYIPHLRAQFERGRPILFTGAGFSMAAKNIEGEHLPSGAKLRELLWPICFPNDAFDDDTTLSDLFDYALRRSPTSCRRFSIEPSLSPKRICLSGMPAYSRCLGRRFIR
jgi:hypothetical protein